MFASCFREIAQTAWRCVVECSPRLEKLFQRSFPECMICGVPQSARSNEWYENLGTIDYLVDAGSLPGFFRQSEAAFVSNRAYLRADPASVESFGARLSTLGDGPKVGIAWRGGAVSTRRSLRSLDLAELFPLTRLSGIRFVSLQHDADETEIIEASGKCGNEIQHWPEVLRDIDQTAALIQSLDLVVSVCTATAHLAGALGRPVWVMVPAIAEWRYMERGETMPWYESARIFRQRQSGSWSSVIADIAVEMSKKIGY